MTKSTGKYLLHPSLSSSLLSAVLFFPGERRGHDRAQSGGAGGHAALHQTGRERIFSRGSSGGHLSAARTGETQQGGASSKQDDVFTSLKGEVAREIPFLWASLPSHSCDNLSQSIPGVGIWFSHAAITLLLSSGHLHSLFWVPVSVQHFSLVLA